MRTAGKGKSKVTEGEGDNEFWKLLGAAPGAAVFFFLIMPLYMQAYICIYVLLRVSYQY
jgi:hypothetical protein